LKLLIDCSNRKEFIAAYAEDFDSVELISFETCHSHHA